MPDTASLAPLFSRLQAPVLFSDFCKFTFLFRKRVCARFADAVYIHSISSVFCYSFWWRRSIHSFIHSSFTLLPVETRSRGSSRPSRLLSLSRLSFFLKHQGFMDDNNITHLATSMSEELQVNVARHFSGFLFSAFCRRFSTSVNSVANHPSMEMQGGPSAWGFLFLFVFLLLNRKFTLTLCSFPR